MSKHGDPWTPEQDRIILTTSQAECVKLWPGRNPPAISARRYFLKNIQPTRNAKGAKPARFTTVEVALLRQHYPTMKNADLRAKHFPGRSIEGIVHKARTLGIQKASEVAEIANVSKEIVREIIIEAKMRGISAIRLDELCGTPRYFKWDWRNSHRLVNLNAVARAVELLGGRLTVDFSASGFGTESQRLLDVIAKFTGAACPKGSRAKAPKKPKPAPASRPAPVRPDNALVRAVAEIVPHGTPDRDDVIQTILMGLLDGTISKEGLRTNRKAVTDAIRATRRSNQEAGGYARSFDQPLRSGRLLHDIMPAPEPEFDHADAA